METEYNIPPQNIELEQRILASCLLDPDDEIFDMLRPGDFYRSAHQNIFKACLLLKNKQEPVDTVTVMETLQHAQQLEDCGGAVYLAKLTESSPVVTNTKHYCKKLKNYSDLRRLLNLSHTVTKKCYNSDAADDVFDYLNTELLKIDRISSDNKFKSIQDLVIECIDHCEIISKQNGVTGIPSGYDDLDAFTCGFQGGDLIILAGRPSMGKTAFMDCCCANACERGHKSAILSLEMAGLQLGNRFLSSQSRINALKFRSGRFSMDDWRKITDAAGSLSRYNIWIDDSPSATYQDVSRKARYAKRHYDIDNLWIDYLGFIDGDKSERRKDLEIQTISRSLKATAKELNIPIILVCQLSRKCEERGDKRPILSDLRDSGSLEQDADVVMFIYRDQVYNKEDTNPEKGLAEINLAKQRNGPTGVIKLVFLEKYMRFENLSF